MSLWVDKYRPESLDKLDYHKDLSNTLRNLANNEEMPHLLVYGPSGAGKKTRIQAILKELYGSKVDKIKVEQRIFTTPSNRKLEINITSSNVHLEINPADVGIYDRVVIQDLIKEIAQTQQVDALASRKFKVVVIKEADQLSRDAQHGLRRTMEKYMHTMRVILCCNSTSRIIGPIQSRCLLVRVAAPSNGALTEILERVAQREGLVLPDKFLAKLVETANGNLRIALLQLEAARVQSYPFSDKQDIPRPDWLIFVAETAREMVQEQSPAR